MSQANKKLLYDTTLLKNPKYVTKLGTSRSLSLVFVGPTETKRLEYFAELYGWTHLVGDLAIAFLLKQKDYPHTLKVCRKTCLHVIFINFWVI